MQCSKSPKYHKRCLSLPDPAYNSLKNIENISMTKSETVDLNPTNTLDKDKNKLLNALPSESLKEKSLKQPLKSYHSLPNLTQKTIKTDSPIIVQSQRNVSSSIMNTPENCTVNNSTCIENETSINESFKLKNFKDKALDLNSKVGKEWCILEGKKEERKKTFMEDGGTSVLPMSTGYFPRPAVGQSLTSFLSSENFSKRVAELDRENAHFSVSEAMIAAIEQMKCNRQLRTVEDVNEDDSDEEINQLKQRIRIRRRQRLEEKPFKNLWSASLLSDGKTDSKLKK